MFCLNKKARKEILNIGSSNLHSQSTDLNFEFGEKYIASNRASSPIGAVAVVGAGIAGIQASLDLAESGFKVYLIESSPAIGGRMAQLDKTFPTNDCAMCILSPKLVECSRHLNIDLMTLTDVLKVEGEPGNFEVTLRHRPRYVDLSKCTGCGVCFQFCPVKVPDEFNQGLSERKAIYLKYPQAVPTACVIDMEHCKMCKVCAKKCQAGAINYDDQEREEKVKVGAVVLALGTALSNAALKEELGFGRYPNVIDALQFERILSPSGPYMGHIKRPSDGNEPKRIAFLQCVGSRDQENPFCSSVCCMYATKQAILVRDHLPDSDCRVFLMDMRAFSKGFDAYFNRAKLQYGIEYIHCRFSNIKEIPGSKNLLVKFQSDSGEIRKEEFDMIVLSIGTRTSDKNRELSERLGIKLNEYNFCQTEELNVLETSRPGVYVCGPFSEPKDIPETVIQASGASAKAMALLAAARHTLVKEKIYPPEKSVEAETPRIGVFVCHCGTNIAGVVNIDQVVEYTKGLPDVVHVENLLYTCSSDSQELIKERIEENKLNRIVVAACSPRTHEPLFQETMKETGLNPYLFEMANIRDQDSWVHAKEPEVATRKAKDLIRMSVARARVLDPLHKISLGLSQNALIVGGGLAGLTAAQSLAEQGFGVYLIEREKELGGNLSKVFSTLQGNDPKEYLRQLIEKVKTNSNITLLLSASLLKTSGFIGNYRSLIQVDGEEREIEHGVTIIATGGKEYRGEEYLLGKDVRVLTQQDLEEKLTAEPDQLREAKTVVMIQCVGPFEPYQDKPFYCSRICCTVAIKNALRIKELNPQAQVVILHKDVRTYGFREKYYTEAREKGVLFVRFTDERLPKVDSLAGDGLRVEVEDLVLKKALIFQPDWLVLSAAILPDASSNDLASILKTPLTEDGFFQEAHVKLRPVDFSAEGLFLCGMAHYPKLFEETISQALAAAGRAATVLSKKELQVGGAVANVVSEKCAACLTCIRVCPYTAPFINQEGVVEIEVAKCQGCGSCAAECPVKAIQLLHYRDDQLISKEEALLEETVT